MTNFEQIIQNKNNIVDLIIGNPEMSSKIDIWYCKEQCPYRSACQGSGECLDPCLYIEDQVEAWLDSEYIHK